MIVEVVDSPVFDYINGDTLHRCTGYDVRNKRWVYVERRSRSGEILSQYGYRKVKGGAIRGHSKAAR